MLGQDRVRRGAPRPRRRRPRAPCSSTARDDIPDVMADLDVLALPSIEPESYGLVLVEALASGTPVVATDHGGPPEIVARATPGTARAVAARRRRRARRRAPRPAPRAHVAGTPPGPPARVHRRRRRASPRSSARVDRPTVEPLADALGTRVQLLGRPVERASRPRPAPARRPSPAARPRSATRW